MTTTQGLDDVARLVAQAELESRLAVMGMMLGHDAGIPREMATSAGKCAGAALALLLAMGASRPGVAVARDSTPLHLLDTPATRALLAALEAAREAGAEVDRERGWVDASGEPIGFGEQLGAMALQLRTEIMGPVGSGLE